MLCTINLSKIVIELVDETDEETCFSDLTLLEKSKPNQIVPEKNISRLTQDNTVIYFRPESETSETIPETQSPSSCQEACGSTSMVAYELIKHLLREPKELLAAKHKIRNPISQESNPGPIILTTKHVVREYPFTKLPLVFETSGQMPTAKNTTN